MQCNIDAKGKAIRFVAGAIILMLGVILALIWALPVGGWIAWAVAGVFITVGGFMLFEARTGWCAVRAMGFRTKV